MKNFQLPDQATILAVLRQRAEKSFAKAQIKAVFDTVAKYHEHPPAHILAKELGNLLEAIKNDRSVFLHCAKAPRNLDSGKHYYDLYYIDQAGRVNKFWPGSKEGALGVVKQAGYVLYLNLI